MHDFRAYILPKLPAPQRGLSAIAELLVFKFCYVTMDFLSEINFMMMTMMMNIEVLRLIFELTMR